MIPKIPLSTLHRSVHGHLIGEASAAGLPPGSWPRLLAVVEEHIHRTFDVTNVYRLDRAVTSGDDLVAFCYVADGLPDLHLLND